MPRHTSGHTFANLRKEAKRWLRALRAHDAAARARLERATPDAPAHPTLRDVQHALARELGFVGWSALKDGITTDGPAENDLANIVSRFLDNACPDHHVRGNPDHVRARHTAMRLLERYPAIAHASFQTAVVCGDIETVARTLAGQPELASRKEVVPASEERAHVGGSDDLVRRDFGVKGWEPLLYLCFTRLPLPAVHDNAVAIARLLLDQGADPNVFFMAGGSRYTPMVGAIGEGEENRPGHSRRNELVDLLLARGADPYDMQVVYNIHFRGDVLWFLQRARARALQLGRSADWEDPDWSMFDMGGYGSGARWHLDIAIKRNDADLARWCLEHGASANAAPARDPRLPQHSVYEEAVRRGHREIAELLVRHGARPEKVVPLVLEAFVAACMRGDRAEIDRYLAAHPEFLRAPEPLLEAASRDRADVVRLLLDLGMSPDIENAQKERPLHMAAYGNALSVAQLLLERGAAIDPVESNWGNTPLGGAVYYGHQALIELLAPHSRDIWELNYAGKVERLRDVLQEDPERARVVSGGHTPLMWLPPHDEALALEAARLFLQHGADPTLRNRDGMTAADRAERLGMFAVAELLRTAATTTSTSTGTSTHS